MTMPEGKEIEGPGGVEIRLDLQAEIDQVVTNDSSLGDIPISEVLTELDSEVERSKNLEYP